MALRGQGSYRQTSTHVLQIQKNIDIFIQFDKISAEISQISSKFSPAEVSNHYKMT